MTKTNSPLATYAEVEQWIYKRAQELTRQEINILKLHYGMGHLRRYSYPEIGKRLGLSAGRVREIAFAAVWRMRHPRLLPPARKGKK